MEHWMNLPSTGKFQTIVDCSNYISDFEWSMTLVGELSFWLGGSQILAIKKHLISNLERGPVLHMITILPLHQLCCQCEAGLQLFMDLIEVFKAFFNTGDFGQGIRGDRR